MLEYNPRIKLRWNDAELALIKTYEENYGIAGPLFVRWVMQNREVVIDMLAKVSARLKKEFDIVDDERFWLAGCTANVTAAILLGDNYAGIINLPVEGIIKSLKKMVTDQRGQMQLSVRTAEDVLADYTTTFYGNLVVFSAADPIGARFGDDTLVEKNTLRTKVAGRVEHEVSPGYVDFYIEEQQLKGHCAALGYGYLDFRAELELRYRVQYVKRFDLLRKTNGPPMRVNVLKISQPKEEFDALVKEADD
jgi:hypothetical protein